MHLVLVTGGTGKLGRVVVQRLLAEGGAVRVLSRQARAATEQEWAAGDLKTGEGLDAALADVDVIIHCATTNGRGDIEAARLLVEAAKRAGKPHVVYISIVGVDQVPLFYYRAKLAAERVIEQSGLPWTILRTTQFHDLIAQLFTAPRWSPAVFVPRGVSFQPIDIHDVADRLAELSVAEPAGRVADLGGPRVRTATDLAHAASGSRPVLRVPIPGRIMRGYRSGAHLTPEHADGRITFEEFLANKESAG